MNRRSVEEIRLLSFQQWRGELTMVLSPDEAKVWLATSPIKGCLTHLVRYATVYGPRNRFSYHAQCGTIARLPVEVQDETFVCARCITQAERYGEPTFNMVPSTGCEASNGKRGMKGTRK